jgi:protein-disulfide isomerase
MPLLRCRLPDRQTGAGADGERLRFVFRNFPIATSHPHAEQAAEAAEAAAAQGRFWEMHDFLYEHQRHLETADVHAYAEELGLEVDRFDRELAEHAHTARVREDFMSGVRSGVNGTPTFYVNGKRHDSSYDIDTLLSAQELLQITLSDEPGKPGSSCKVLDGLVGAVGC